MKKLPKIAQWILYLTNRKSNRENVLGDLEEFYDEIYNSSGKSEANRWIWKQVKRSLPESIKSRFYWGGVMIAKYLKSIIRQILKQRLFSAVNILGLSIGMIACLLILQHVVFEKSYDNFLDNNEQIYRVLNYRYYNTGLDKSAGCSSFVGPTIKEEFPEVTEFTRCRKINTTIQYGENVHKEERVFFADSSFFSLFSFSVIEGNKTEMLRKPHTVVLTESTSKKYFGNSNPIGKTLIVGNSSPYLVTGIVEDVPENSHLKFDILLSFQSQYSDGFCELCNNNNTYIQLKKNTDPQVFESKLPGIIEKIHGTESNTFEREYLLQPLCDIHLYSNVRFEHEHNGDGNAVNTLTFVAIAILVLAYFNYINLTSAQYAKRFKETGLRRVIGAERIDIIKQILFESFVYNVIALILAFLVIALLRNPIETILEHRINVELLTNVWFWISMFGVIITGSVLSGIYPAVVMSSITPSQLLRGIIAGSGKSRNVRKLLIVFQFSIAVILICGSLVVFSQISFMRNSDIGANIEKTVAVNSPSKFIKGVDYSGRMDSFISDMRNESAILDVTYTFVYPGVENGDVSGGIRPESSNEEDEQQIYMVWAARNFLEFFEIPLICGRNFYESDLTIPFDWRISERGIIINEAARIAFGFESPEDALGNNIIYDDRVAGNVVGVIENYHQQSLDKPVNPIICFGSQWGTNFVFRINDENTRETLAVIKERFLNYYPGNPFIYSFVDEVYDRQYKSDILFEKIFGMFTVMAILIACLGLLGLISFTTEQKTKEIGIRKVVGASVSGVSFLIIKEMIWMVLVANIVAMPVAYYGLNKWLTSYAYRIEITWAPFLISGILTFLIAMITVSYQTLKAASANPIDSIKCE